jgi:opacity protein-like surface antigen
MKKLLILLAVFAMAASAADITGNWKATADMNGQALERTFTFKQDGAKLTGETNSQMMGKSAIADGKVEGDAVTFTVNVDFQGNQMKMNYKGQIVSPTQIKFTVEMPGGGAGGASSIQWDARKQ